MNTSLSHTRWLTLLLLTSVLVRVAPATARETVIAEKITEGLYYARYEVVGVLAHVLKFNLDARKLHIRSLKAEGKETLRTMVERLNERGERVVGAINGDFFKSGSRAGIPMGLQVSDGQLIFGPSKRSMIGFSSTNRPYIGVVNLKASVYVKGAKKYSIEAINTFEKDMKRSGIYLYTPEFQEIEIRKFGGIVAVVDKVLPGLQVGEKSKGTITKVLFGGGETFAIPEDGCVLYFLGTSARALKNKLAEKTELTLDIELPPLRGEIPQAIGGGPRLIRAGRPSVEFTKEDFPRTEILYLHHKQHPRSAVGYDRARKTLYFVVVEGRQQGIKGMRMDELASFMRELGCHEAMAFDGGGSAAMYVLGRGIVSTSVGGGGNVEERRIGNSLLITMTRPREVEKPPIFRSLKSSSR